MRRRRKIQDEDPLLDAKFEHHHREPPIRELCLGGPSSSSGIVTKAAPSAVYSIRNTTQFPSSKSLSSVDPMEIISSRKTLSSWMGRRMQFGGWNFLFVVAATFLLAMTCPVNAAAAFVPTRASCQRRKEPQNLSLDNHKNSILISSLSDPFSAEKRTTTSVIVQVASANRPSTESASAEEYLQSLTVQALKQKIKDGPPPAPRGLLSTLKRKQDMIEYLLEQQQQERHPEDPPPPQPSQPTVSSTSTAEPASTTISTNDKVEEIKDHHDDSIHHNHHPQSNPKKGPLKMPPMINNHHQEEDVQENQKTPREEEEDASTTAPSDNNDETIKLSRRDQLFEQVFERYPPLRDTYVDLNTNINLDDVDDDNVDGGGGINPMMADIRQQYHPIFSGPNNISSCDMDITFLGTASCTPGFTRGVSCTALRLNWRRRAAFQDPQVYHNNNKNNQQQQQSGTTTTGTFQGGTWLFDAGECTQLQLQRTPVVKPSKVTKIFLTHAHGDHSFGLPGLMCILGQDRSRTATTPQDNNNNNNNNNNKENHNFNTVIDVYGPEGLRKWLRVAIRYSVSRIVPPYRVHELRDVPMAPEWKYHARLGRYLYKGATGAHHSQNKNINNNTPPPQQQQPSPRPTMPWGRQGLAGEDPNSWITLADGIDLEPSMQYGEVGGGRYVHIIIDNCQCRSRLCETRVGMVYILCIRLVLHLLSHYNKSKQRYLSHLRSSPLE